jgi:ketosteroid isomerase-like protein
VSHERVETVRGVYEHVATTGELPPEKFAPDCVWDMSTFEGWLEQPTYAGFEAAAEFVRDWVRIWDDWELILEELHDAGDGVVGVVRQRGCAEETGVPLEMRFGQVWTFRGETLIRTENYADPAEAMAAAGL